MSLLQVENLTKRFEGLVAVNDVTFNVDRGEILAIIGPNGAGKSSLFNLVSGILRPTSGRVFLEGQDITGLKPHRIAQMGITRTFQTTTLFNQLRVADNLAIGYRMRTASGFWSTIFHTRRWKEDREKTMARVLEVLDFIGMTDKAFDFVSTLSQEEQKRLAIGVALAGEPKAILLDEPTGGLIQEDTDGITQLIKKIKAAGITVCLIEHKMNMVMDLADRIVVLNYGNKLAEGTPGEISTNPAVIEAYLGREYVA
ncbi:MAG: ABC transporter ATP-binding protein [Peptococcaceae bacterium]|nr:ABC transporter ATP-binding protein [Peptococcaceae bacterium]